MGFRTLCVCACEHVCMYVGVCVHVYVCGSMGASVGGCIWRKLIDQKDTNNVKDVTEC